MILENFRQLKNVDFDITEVLTHCQSWKDGQSFSYLETPRPDHGLYFLQSGKASYQLDDGSFLFATAGEVMFLPQGSIYKVVCYAVDGTLPCALLINFKLPNIQLPKKITRIAKDDGSIARRFSEIIDLYRQSAFSLMKAKLYETMELLTSETNDPYCIDYIGKHLGELHTVAALAKRASMCESAYRKKFKQQTGQSPLKYINTLKIERACRLLQSPEIQMEEISDMLGFFDLSHFYKVFKAITGKTPAAYKKRVN